MPQPQNAMEIFKLLDRSNCRACGHKTCLAFAGAVFKGERSLDECPKLGAETIQRYAGHADAPSIVEQKYDEYIQRAKDEIAGLDLAAAAERTGGRFAEGRLILKVLGKDFSVDTKGALHTDIHVNPWVALPFYSYVLYGKGLPPAGNWMSFRELKEGKDRYPLFRKRCEAAIKRVADRYPDLFEDMVNLFAGKQVDAQFAADISVVLHPLPRVPIMVCYWLPDDGLLSGLNIFFDQTANDNLDIGSVFSLGAGLAQMFERLAQRHGA